MLISEFVKLYKDKKIANTKIAPDAVGNFIKENVNITKYIPFVVKRDLAELIVQQCTEEVDGVKEHDAIESYMRFVVAMIETHTDLGFSDDPVTDYDLLAEAGLLMPVIDMFRADYDESNTVLKMALAAELESNNIKTQVGKFLNGILNKLDGLGEMIKSRVENLDLNKALGGDFNEEDLAKLGDLLNTYNK